MNVAMGIAEELFERDAALPLPEAIRWKRIVAQTGATLVVELQRPRTGLSFAPACLAVSFDGAEPPVPDDEPILWDAELHRWLVEHGVRAIDAGNERERFGFAFHDAFEAVERRAGLAAFGAYLLAYLRSSALAELDVVRRVLEKAEAPAVDPSGVAGYVEWIRRIVASAARAIESLGYARAEAIEILAGAVAYYVDDRFGITWRAMIEAGR